MGLLNFDGEPLSWENSKPYLNHIKEHGITQFLNIYNSVKDRHGDILKWGDEVNSCTICIYLVTYSIN